MASDSIAPGTVIAERYVVEALIGAGGMGQVYKCSHRLTRRPVALKLLREELSQNGEIVARFLREAQAAASIGDHHVVEVFDMGQVAPQGAYYLALEFLDGESLSALIAREGALAIRRVAHIGRQLAAVLGKAHAGSPKIVHRDLKPDNVFLIEREGDRDFVKVLDFGIAKLLDGSSPSTAASSPRLTQTEQVMGTPLYMPAEQLRSARDVDERADVYAIGVILFEMLTGTLPLSAASFAEQYLLVMTQPAPSVRSLRPEVPAALDLLVARCLEKDPTLRPSNGAVVADALAPFVALRAPSVDLGLAATAVAGARVASPIELGHTQATQPAPRESQPSIDAAMRSATLDGASRPSATPSNTSTKTAIGATLVAVGVLATGIALRVARVEGPQPSPAHASPPVAPTLISHRDTAPVFMSAAIDAGEAQRGAERETTAGEAPEDARAPLRVRPRPGASRAGSNAGPAARSDDLPSRRFAEEQ